MQLISFFGQRRREAYGSADLRRGSDEDVRRLVGTIAGAVKNNPVASLLDGLHGTTQNDIIPPNIISHSLADLLAAAFNLILLRTTSNVAQDRVAMTLAEIVKPPGGKNKKESRSHLVSISEKESNMERS